VRTARSRSAILVYVSPHRASVVRCQGQQDDAQIACLTSRARCLHGVVAGQRGRFQMLLDIVIQTVQLTQVSGDRLRAAGICRAPTARGNALRAQCIEQYLMIGRAACHGIEQIDDNDLVGISISSTDRAHDRMARLRMRAAERAEVAGLMVSISASPAGAGFRWRGSAAVLRVSRGYCAATAQELLRGLQGVGSGSY